MFVEDSRIKYEGKQINNTRLNITSNELIDYLIDLYDIYFFITNKGDRASQYLLTEFTRDEQLDLNTLEISYNGINRMIEMGNDPNSKCFCGNPKEFKDCHGLIIKELKEKHRA